ncbi:MAG: arylsulfatase [Planctomycetes bacterium]|nr:arylsulfatase [Planctomycetota bacterium]
MLRATLALATCALAACAVPSGTTARPPNVLIVLADDLGYGDPRCYNDESKIPTPRMDALAAEGLRFTDAHAPASVCSPTRYGILTGRYAWRGRLQRGVLMPLDPPLIEPELETLPELLRQRGYRSACIGKWHLGWDWPLKDGGHVSDVFAGVGMDLDARMALMPRIDFTRRVRGGPLAHGFDEYFGDDVPNHPPYAFIDGDRLVTQPTAMNDAELYGHDGPMSPGWDDSMVLPTLAQRAASWLDEHARQADPRPFFLYFALTSPHTPIAPSTRWRGVSQAGAYGDYVAETDWALGVVLDAVARNGFAEDTLVVFCSDNGSPRFDGEGMQGEPDAVIARYGHDPSRPWRGRKGELYEGGHRVPLLLRWPRVVTGPAVADRLVSLTDLYRTIANLGGAKPAPGSGEDSLDLLPLLRGANDDAHARGSIVHHASNGTFGFRSGTWKLLEERVIEELPDGAGSRETVVQRLFDLAGDPGESIDLAAERPELVARLREEFEIVRLGRGTAGHHVPR